MRSQLLSIIFLIVLTTNSHQENAHSKKLSFPVYSYKKNSDLENKYYGRFNRCSMRTDCQNYELEELQNCVLQCISAKCYQEIYAADPLEEGEIDQRIQSYKGCLYLELK